MQSVWRRVVVCLIAAVSVSVSARLHAQGLPEDGQLAPPAAGVVAVAAPATTAATAFTVDLTSFNPGANIERSACVTVAIRANLAYECGDLRMTYSLPVSRFRNQARAPEMLYNSQFARPTPIVRALVVPTGAWPGGLVSVTAILRVQKSLGATFDRADSVTWTAAQVATSLGAGLPAQLALRFDASDLMTNLYPIRVEIIMNFGGGNVQTSTPIASELAIVNRKGSEFGTGWWMAGYERLQRLPDGNLFWIGGDGSTRRYTLQGTNNAGVKIYAARPLTGMDSLTQSPDSTFRRHLSRGAYVHFDSTGRHDLTVSSLGAVTRFESQRCNFLTGIILNPSVAQTSAEQRWWLTNDGYDADDPCAVYDPANPSAWYVHITGITSGTRYIWRFLYPDSGSFLRQSGPGFATAERYSYTESNGRIRTYRDALGTETRIGWDANGTIVADSIALSPLNPDSAKRYIVHRFRAGEAAAVSSPLHVDSVYTRLAGPRTDVIQETKLSLGAFGQPKQIVNALGHTTQLTYHPTFPLLATKVRAPNGFSRYATYDAYGSQLTASADAISYDEDGPVTTYVYDPAHPDNVTSVTDPTGVTTSFQYDSLSFARYPILTAQQLGTDTSAKVRFFYCEGAQNPCVGLPRATLSAANAQGARSRDSVRYDGLGNLNLTLSAGGKRTEFVNDAIGRVLVSRTALSAESSPRWLTDSTFYDLLDRVTRTTQSTWGDGTAGSGFQAVSVNTGYLGATGLPVSVTRSANDGTVGTLRDSTEYDAAGRIVRRFAQGVTTAEVLTYDQAGNLTRRETARGGQITTTYDALNRPARVITWAMTYDSLRIGTATHSQIFDLSLRPAFPRENLGRNSRLVIDDDTATFTYEVGSGQIATANNRAARISRNYFANGALQSETQNIRTVTGDDFSQHSYFTSYTYDLAGRRRSLRHPTQLAPGSTLETWTYDPLTGRPVSVRDPMDSTVTFGFDPAGQLARQISPINVARVYEYSLDGEVVLDKLAPGNATPGPPISPLATPLDPLPRNYQYPGQFEGFIRYVDYGYDARGKLMTAKNSMGLRDSMTFEYTPMGHLRKSTYATRYYDYLGILSTTDSLRMTETIRPDAMGTSTWRQSAMLGYTLVGAVYAQGRYSSSGERIPTYTPNTGRLAQTILCSPGSCVPLAKDTLRYDASGNTYVQQHVDLQSQVPYGGVGQLEATERVMYYNAADQLVAVDARIGSAAGADNYLHFQLSFDSYRYDALGRRVFTRSQRLCPMSNQGVQPGADFFVECNLGYVQRTVWDGAKELYEVRMPDQSQHWEKDGFAAGDTLGVVNNNATDKIIDRDAFYGRVGYVYGGAIDKPLVMLRQDYGDRNFRPNQNAKPYRRFQPFALYPQWDLRGEPSLGTSADGGISRCEMDGTVKRCTYAMAWTQVWAPNGKQIDPLFRGWAGSLLQDKRDPNGLLYRRNRYLDPATGRFTQPDPIGLAGGLNAYGYANGDPVSYGDPFGTCVGPIALVCVYLLVDGIPTAVILTAEVATGLTLAGRLSGAALVSRGVVGELASRNSVIVAGETILAVQPSVRLASGSLRKPDFLVAARDGTRRFVESKFGGAVKTAKQIADDAELLLKGGTLIGKNVEEALRGTATGPIATETKNVLRP